MAKQYMAKYINFPRFTIFIMNLHAKHPDINAAKNPNIIGYIPNISISEGSFNIFIKSKKASPNIGIITIKKENCATFSFLFPNNNPVEIVVPERDNPGNTATACDNPMINACR